MPRAALRSLAGALAVLLAACGGGGGGGGGASGTPGNPATGTHSISGVVRQAGAGKAGVTVTLGGAATASTTTGAGGDYSFGGLGNGDFTVTPSLPGHGFSPATHAVSVTGASVTGKDFSATAEPTEEERFMASSAPILMGG